MTQFSQLRPTRRAPRVSLRGSISATLQLENGRQLSARLHQLSITGGLLELSSYIEERTWIGLTIPVSFGAIYPTAEMLFPMRGGIGYLQPFRIVRIREDERLVLDKEVTELLRQTLAPASVRPGSGPRQPRYYLEST
jgi:hypothetical protein